MRQSNAALPFWPAEIPLLYSFLESDTKVPVRSRRKHIPLRTAQSGPIFFFLDFPRTLRHHAPIPARKACTAHLEVIFRPLPFLGSNVPADGSAAADGGINPK